MNRSLQEAATLGDVDQLDQVLQEDLGDVGEYDKEHALLRAAFHGQKEIVCRLLELGVNCECENIDGGAPFIQAATNNHLEILSMLIRAGCDINSQADRDRGALHMAVVNHHPACIVYLIRCGCELDLKDTFGDTPLMIAARRGHVDSVETLLGAGSELETRSQGGDTALHYAAQYGHTKCIAYLLKHNPDLEAVTIWGHTPLSFAAMRGHDEATLLLLQEGADFNIAERSGRTVLHYCAKYGLQQSALYILQSPDLEVSVINAKDTSGITPLVEAIRSKKLYLFRLLIQHGAAIRVVAKTTIKRTYQFWTVLDIAIELEKREIALIIVQCGAKLSDLAHVRDSCDESDMYDFVRSRLRSPLDLTEYCRLQLRCSLVIKYHSVINSIRLPKTIKSFLLFE